MGGLIVLGVRTVRDPATAVESAADVPGVRAESVNDTQYRDLVLSHVFPLVRDFDIVRHDGVAGGTSVLLIALYIEAQGESDRPFIVDRVPCGGDDDPDPPHSVGLPTRWGAQTHWDSPERIHGLIRNGYGRSVPAVAPGHAVSRELEAQEDLEFVGKQEEWDEWGWYAVQAVPTGPGAIRDFYGGFREAARQWHGLRSDGFDLNLDWDLQPLGPRLASLLTRQATILRPSGVLTAGALGSPDFLGWAQSRPGAAREELTTITINPWVLVEFTVEAIRCAYELVNPILAEQAGWRIFAIGRHFQDRVPIQLRLDVGSGPSREVVPATTNEFIVDLDGTGDSLKDAFSLLAKVFGTAFGVGVARIPFSRDGRIEPGLFSAG